MLGVFYRYRDWPEAPPLKIAQIIHHMVSQTPGQLWWWNKNQTTDTEINDVPFLTDHFLLISHTVLAISRALSPCSSV